MTIGQMTALRHLTRLRPPENALIAPAPAEPLPEALARYCPHVPTPKQQEFLNLRTLEALYGGAAGGGKSDALLMGALQYVDVPNYNALILRRTFKDLAKPGAIMDRADSWLRPTDAQWRARDRLWEFPSGATLSFGYVQRMADVYQYQGTDYQYIGWDELTQHELRPYQYMFSRTRRLQGFPVPIRVRSATNPGGVGHDWVKQRFVGGPELADPPTAPFVKALLEDNPYIDREEYVRSLGELDDVTLAQLLEGNWDVLPSGDIFLREWFPADIYIDAAPIEVQLRLRYWDRAGTKGAGAYTAGCKMSRLHSGIIVVEHMERGQWAAVQRDAIIDQIAAEDGVGCAVYGEQEPGSSGKDVSHAMVTRLAGYDVGIDVVTGDKATRARPLAAQFKHGNVRIVRGRWNPAFVNELVAAPDGPYMDQVDASSGAFNMLTRRPVPGRPKQAENTRQFGRAPGARQFGRSR